MLTPEEINDQRLRAYAEEVLAWKQRYDAERAAHDASQQAIRELPSAICRTIAFAELVYLFKQIAPVPLCCIGTTQRGDPLHPSRAPYTDAPHLWYAPENAPASAEPNSAGQPTQKAGGEPRSEK